ncbi:hypothetical protein [Dactylosporangium sp. NPDC005555]|uniref:hypothetical protein n=1 Tax=Dactylosporangium sp. NPDC005555 TaxID=3154889 RepID=UPI0033B08A90
MTVALIADLLSFEAAAASACHCRCSARRCILVTKHTTRDRVRDAGRLRREEVAERLLFTAVRRDDSPA